MCCGKLTEPIEDIAMSVLNKVKIKVKLFTKRGFIDDKRQLSAFSQSRL